MFSLALPDTALAEKPFDRVKVRVWPAQENAERLPELHDDAVRVPWLLERPSFGIAFSGGGTRAATAALGQLRALHMLGWLDHARYLSANSGGSWTVWPYTFLDQGMDACWLGTYVPPALIDDDIIDAEQEAEPCSMSAALYRTKFWNRLGAFVYGNEVFSDALGRMFLEPFGLRDRDKVFTFHAGALAAIRANNPDLRREDFFCVTQPRPYPVILGTLTVPANRNPFRPNIQNGTASEVVRAIVPRGPTLFPIEATPIYTGVRDKQVLQDVRRNLSYAGHMLVGGGYVESFGYDSYEPLAQPYNGIAEVKLRGRLLRGHAPVNRRYRFTLSDVIGMSGAAPAVTISRVLPGWGLFPGYRHWTAARADLEHDVRLRKRSMELLHGDGGDVDNMALSALLVRRVENILVLLNPDQPFELQKDRHGRFLSAARQCGTLANTDEADEPALKDDLVAYFRNVPGTFPKRFLQDDTGSKLRGLCETFHAQKREGRPLVHCDTYQVLSNERFGIRGDGYRPRICWVYLDNVGRWLAQIKADGGKKTHELKFGIGDYERFPHYRTIAERGPTLIDLDRERVHALSNLTAWTLLASQEQIAGYFPALPLTTGRVLPDEPDASNGACRCDQGTGSKPRWPERSRSCAGE